MTIELSVFRQTQGSRIQISYPVDYRIPAATRQDSYIRIMRSAGTRASYRLLFADIFNKITGTETRSKHLFQGLGTTDSRLLMHFGCLYRFYDSLHGVSLSSWAQQNHSKLEIAQVTTTIICSRRRQYTRL